MKSAAKYGLTLTLGVCLGLAAPMLLSMSSRGTEPPPTGDQKKKTGGSSLGDLSAKWHAMREETRREIVVAERILATMRGRGAKETDVNAQAKVVDDLKKREAHCDGRLREIAEQRADANEAPPSRQDTMDELDVQHDRLLDELRLKKIGVAP